METKPTTAERLSLSKQTIDDIYSFTSKLINEPDKVQSIVEKIVPVIIDYTAIKKAEVKIKLKRQAYSLVRLYVIKENQKEETALHKNIV